MEEKIKKNKFKESNCVCLKKKHLKTKSGTRFSIFEIKHTKIYQTSVIIKTVNSNYMTSFIKPKISNHNHLVHTFNFSLLTHRKKNICLFFLTKLINICNVTRKMKICILFKIVQQELHEGYNCETFKQEFRRKEQPQHRNDHPIQMENSKCNSEKFHTAKEHNRANPIKKEH